MENISSSKKKKKNSSLIILQCPNSIFYNKNIGRGNKSDFNILPTSSTLVSRPPSSIVEVTIKNSSDTLKLYPQIPNKLLCQLVISVLNPFTNKHMAKLDVWIDLQF